MNYSEDYNQRFQQKFGRTATSDDLTRLLNTLFNQVSTTEKALVPIGQKTSSLSSQMKDVNLTDLVLGIQETSPDITGERVDEAFSQMYEEEQHTKLHAEMVSQKRGNRIKVGALVAGTFTGLLLFSGATYLASKNTGGLKSTVETTASLTTPSTSSMASKEARDLYFSDLVHGMPSEIELPGWAVKSVHENVILDETFDGIRILAKTYSPRAADFSSSYFKLNALNDYLAISQFDTSGLLSTHIYNSGWSLMDVEGILEDAEPMVSLYFNLTENVVTVDFDKELFTETKVKLFSDKKVLGWGPVYLSSDATRDIPEKVLNNYLAVAEKYLGDFRVLYAKRGK